MKAFIVIYADGNDLYSEDCIDGVFATLDEALAHINSNENRNWHHIEEWDGTECARALDYEGKPFFS
ncbi:MAG: hypothetical protein WC986_14480 [Elusimicrobiota bacterium]